jgi:hypothetical protein
MKCASVRAGFCALVLLACATLPFRAAAAESPKSDPSFAGLQGEVLLDNERVFVQRFVIQPGQSTGRHMHPADQLLVIIKGGVLRSRATERATLWRDGRVVWQSATDPADEGSINAGAAPVEMDLVTLKPVVQSAAAVPGGRPKYQYWRGRLDAHDRYQRRTPITEHRQEPDRSGLGHTEEVVSRSGSRRRI